MKRILGFGCFFLGIGILIGVILADPWGVLLAMIAMILGYQLFCCD